VALFIGVTAFVEHEKDLGTLITLALGVFTSYSAFETPIHTYFLNSWVTYTIGIVGYLLVGAVIWSPLRWRIHLKDFRDNHLADLLKFKKRAECTSTPEDFGWTPEVISRVEAMTQEFRTLKSKRIKARETLSKFYDVDDLESLKNLNSSYEDQIPPLHQDMADEYIQGVARGLELDKELESLQAIRDAWETEKEDIEYASNKHYRLMFETQVSENKGRITRWITFWVFDLSWQALKNPIKAMGRLMYHLVEGWYLKIRKSILGDLELLQIEKK